MSLGRIAAWIVEGGHSGAHGCASSNTRSDAALTFETRKRSASFDETSTILTMAPPENAKRRRSFKGAELQDVALELFPAKTSGAGIHLEDLKLIGLLGCGAYGRVRLVEYRNSTYALKVMNKGHLLQQRQLNAEASAARSSIPSAQSMPRHACHSSPRALVERIGTDLADVLRERWVLQHVCEHPFLQQIVDAYQDEHEVYLLVDAMLGGYAAQRPPFVISLILGVARFMLLRVQ
jgi:serine/threonine protein kinase